MRVSKFKAAPSPVRLEKDGRSPLSLSMTSPNEVGVINAASTTLVNLVWSVD